MARIGMVLENDFPSDLRVEKEAVALREGGHEVHLLCLEFGVRPERETVSGLHVHRRRLSRRAYRKLHPTLLRLPVYPRLWSRWVERFVDTVGPDLLHVHDLPLAAAVQRVGAARKIPVVLDFHENFPAAIRGWGFDRGPLGRFFYGIDRWESYEREAAARAAGVIVVVSEASARIESHGVPPDRIAVVSNTDRVDYGSHVPSVDAAAPAPIELLYIGGFGPHRGLETAMDAIALLDADAPVRLRLVGDGRIRDALVARLRAGGRDHQISVGSWVPQSQVPFEIGACHVGIVPHLRNDHTNTTVPHKLFLYMAMGRPVIVSDCAPLKRVVEDTGAGVVFRAGDPASMAEAVRSLLDPESRRRMGEAGRRAVADRYNWGRDGAVLRSFHEGLLAS